MKTYITRDGDRLDRITNAAYNNSKGALEVVLKANPGLASRPPIFPAGIPIRLPELNPATDRTTVKLWS